MISGLVFVVIACAAALACVLIAWAARGAKAEEGRKWVAGLPDLLLYASMIDDGILLLQDGALMATWRYAGPDLGSATHEEMAALAERLNSVLKLGSGWLVHCDAIRCEVNEYAKQGAFPDSVTSLIDDERRAQFKAEGRHYESTYFISLTYLPPMQSEEKVKGFLFKGGSRRQQDCWRNRPHLFQRSSRAVPRCPEFAGARGAPPGTPRRWRRWGGNGVDQLRSGAVCAPLRHWRGLSLHPSGNPRFPA